MERAGLLDKAPFIRIALPFTAGIAAEECVPHIFLWPSLIVGLFFLVFHYYTLRRIELRFRYRYLFVLAAGALLFSAGCFALQTSRPEEPNIDGLYRYAYVVAEVDEIEQGTEKSYGVKSTVVLLLDEERRQRPVSFPALLRIERDSVAPIPQRGDLLLFGQHLAPIANKKNPEAPDYAAAMRRKGFIYSQYLPARQWKTVGSRPEHTWKSRALQARDKALRLIDEAQFSPSTGNILKALLSGYTQELTTGQRAAFSSAGLSHILAVSGLHVGIIWAIFGFIFYPLVWLRMKRIRAACILAGLWGYAFFTGLSPSVVRACVMASVVLAGILLGRKGNGMNGLFTALFIMLLYNPYYLFQAGFQLSFLAVFSILLVYPPLYALWSPQHKAVRYLWSLLAVSAAAQLGTLPLAVYYFHELPLLGLLSNLLVVPLLPILLSMGFLWIAMAAAGHPVPLLARCIDAMAGGIEQCAQHIAALGYASVRNIWIEPHTLILLFVVIFGGTAFLLTRRARILVGVLLFTLSYLIVDTVISRPPMRNLWAVYQESGSTSINFIDNGNNIVLRLDSLPSRSAEQAAERFWLKNGIDNLTHISVSDTISTGNLIIKQPFIEFQGDRILLLNDTRWSDMTSHERISVDYAIVCPGFKGKIDVVRRLFDIHQVILTQNLSHFQQTALQEECARLKIPCHRIRTDGAWIATH